jgi:AcrR family transcriptional regulator
MATRPSANRPRLRWADDTPVDGDDARGRITAAAVECVERYGPAKTTMDDVAQLAAITRPTVYKYFPSRNELLIAAFLRVLDRELEAGLADFFEPADDATSFREAIAQSAAYGLRVMRESEVLQAILHDSRIPVEDLLTGAAGLLLDVMQQALVTIIGESIDDEQLARVIRPFDPGDAAHWIIRMLYAFLVWPEPDRELTFFRDYLAPAFIRDE